MYIHLRLQCNMSQSRCSGNKNHLFFDNQFAGSEVLKVEWQILFSVKWTTRDRLDKNIVISAAGLIIKSVPFKGNAHMRETRALFMVPRAI
jgi:hypothetical protein